MVVSRTLRATACASCRWSILRSFTALAGPSVRTPQLSVRASRCSRPNQQPGSSWRLFSDDKQLETISEKKLGEESVLAEESLPEKSEELRGATEEKEAVEGAEVTAVPWYLQVESPHRAPKPLSERQSLPDLPESPPPILQPLLQQISIDLGLDDLSLLDLRKLDPPPALGANLLMVLGTARSEKHLHVSADRLCRWLRSTYKLRPDADGLLGRNELKLKLKRKAKRAKLMGSANDETGDDGVRTGWVCVDIGVVDGGEAVADSHRQDNFVGFGRRTDGVRIVVQMLTEEKREEIELEKLWSGILKRGGELENDPSETMPQVTASQSALPKPTERTSLAAMLGRGQTREFHTATRRMSSTASSEDFDFDNQAMEDLLMRDIVVGAYDHAVETLRQYIPYTPSLQQGKWKMFLLKFLRSYLERVPRERAIEELGVLDSGFTSTPYMTCFNELLSSIPSEAEAEIRIWLACFARDLGHDKYSPSKLFALFQELQVSGIKVSQMSYMRLLKGILSPDNGGSHHGPPRASAGMAMKILRAMHDQGFEILSEDLLVNIQEVTGPHQPAENPPQSSIYTDPSDTFYLPSLPMSSIQARLHPLIMSLELPLFKDVSRMRLMDTYARLGHWKEFFEIFRMAPNKGKPQSANVYAFMFGSVAQTGYQKSCKAVLRAFIPELELESPAIELDGDVGEAIRACLRIADPFVEQHATDPPEINSEWLALWKRLESSGGQKTPFLYG
ncbi:hypothetical protein BKA65DRAFT_497572 [Rhexocercosporidium sp. MPI-PUGE-AT-0058]|nr:hypothetical protein BKA65DRAFT_497572 [Rhexocercosporidium sp. MPI-PUGE-AT-0058]